MRKTHWDLPFTPFCQLFMYLPQPPATESKDHCWHSQSLGRGRCTWRFLSQWMRLQDKSSQASAGVWRACQSTDCRVPPWSFWFCRTGVGLRTWISNQFPGDTDAAGPGTELWESLELILVGIIKACCWNKETADALVAQKEPWAWGLGSQLWVLALLPVDWVTVASP